MAPRLHALLEAYGRRTRHSRCCSTRRSTSPASPSSRARSRAIRRSGAAASTCSSPGSTLRDQARRPDGEAGEGGRGMVIKKAWRHAASPDHAGRRSAARSPISCAGCGAASRGSRWLVPLAVFLCLFGVVLILATTRRGARAVHLRDLLSVRGPASASCSPARPAQGRSRRTGPAAGAAPATRCSTAFPTLRLPGDPRTDAVRRFYERAPFPGYPPRDSLQALRARAERSPFAAPARSRDPRRRADRRGRLRHRPDVPVSWRAPIASIVGADLTARVARPRRRSRAPLRPRAACGSSRPTCGGRA